MLQQSVGLARCQPDHTRRKGMQLDGIDLLVTIADRPDIGVPGETFDQVARKQANFISRIDEGFLVLFPSP